MTTATATFQRSLNIEPSSGEGIRLQNFKGHFGMVMICYQAPSHTPIFADTYGPKDRDATGAIVDDSGATHRDARDMVGRLL